MNKSKSSSGRRSGVSTPTEVSAAKPGRVPESWKVVSPEDSGNDQWGVAIADYGIGMAYIVEEIGQDHDIDQGERIARLIAAAPELLAVARRAILAATWKDAKRSGLFDDARAAIAKVERRS